MTKFQIELDFEFDWENYYLKEEEMKKNNLEALNKKRYQLRNTKARIQKRKKPYTSNFQLKGDETQLKIITQLTKRNIFKEKNCRAHKVMQ